MDNSCPNEGRSLGGYRLGPILGRGAMGVVYKGFAPSSGMEVAVKTLRPDLLASGERDRVLERFLHEAAISKSLRHENIIHVLDSGQDGVDVFMAMELVLGRELKEALDSGKPMDLDRIEILFSKVLAALSYSHEKGIIHRDIKPSNILLVDSGNVKVMDFGIARVESSEMTQAGAMLGTPSYMSPEQVIGECVDRRTDIYSAGVVLYQLLTGKKPFQGSLTQIMQQVLSTVPAAPSSVNIRVSRAFDSIIARSMAKERDGRFLSAKEFSDALADAFACAREEDLNDVTVFVDMDATVLDDGTMLASMPAPEALSDLGTRMKELLQKGLDKEFSDCLVSECRKLADDYVNTVLAASGGSMPPADPRLSAVLERDCSVFGDCVLPRVKELILEGAPLPGKSLCLNDRSDWMGCIDIFTALSKTLEDLGRPGVGEALARVVRAELLGACMMYAGHINTYLFSPDHLEITRIAADFMRLDILQWGVEELGGEMEVRQISNQVQMFSGQVLKRVAAAIREFTHGGDMMSRFDVANFMCQIDELIVVAERTLDADGACGYQLSMGREIVIDFIAAAEGLVEIYAAELLGEVSAPDAKLSAFTAKLKQLARLFLFATHLDDEECRTQVLHLAGAVRQSVEALVPVVESVLADAVDEQASLHQNQLTAIWETAESLGWSELNARLLIYMRNEILTDQNKPNQR
ncbi:serine/threonine-protein kinase [Maridesulfovibrio sp.]|uniref:serine/threonine-protein kinase n=1 Tax=Maridesulfovibrio sp. TaxID=2795000 RepID=UPI002A18B808|nr:serine/threonine-protein kinase [Maridesulfovibrio sp.]